MSRRHCEYCDEGLVPIWGWGEWLHVFGGTEERDLGKSPSPIGIHHEPCTRMRSKAR